MKRKTENESATEAEAGNAPDLKRRQLDDATVTARFHAGLLERDNLEKYKKYYAESEP